MTGYLLIGAIIVLVILAGGGGRVLRLPTWRIGSAMGALFAFTGAGYALIRRAWPVAIVLVVLGLWMSVSARFPREGQRRRTAQPPPSPERGRMSLAEARSILGVEETATRAEIQAAYMRLMKRVHPDNGGAPGLAAQLNSARDRLLKG